MNDTHNPQLIRSEDGSAVELKGRVVIAGSDTSCGVHLASPAPKRLAHFMYLNGSYQLHPLSGGGLVKVNGSPVKSPISLNQGDEVELGGIKYTYYTHSNSGAAVVSPVSELVDVLVSLLKDRNLDVHEDLVASVSRLLKCDAARLVSETQDSSIKTLATYPAGASMGRYSERAIKWAGQASATVLMREGEWEDPEKSMGSLETNLVGSVLCAPIKAGSFILGYLYLDRLQHSAPFTEEDRAFCDTLRPLFQEILQIHSETARQRDAISRLQENNLVSKSKLIYESQVMEEVLQTAGRVAFANSPVFIYGETGTGKEVIAKIIHNSSPRKNKNFVAVNCGAIPENLMESELFGHEKGAFTGAHQMKKGLFEMAHEGTLFLDETGELPLSLQVKLLRALQESEVMRVGGSAPIPVDVRVISATNRDLSGDVKAGRFREDLYFRLNVINIHLPPLRERGGDILLLADYFTAKYCQQFGFNKKTLDAPSKKELSAYAWPGNIRELENLIQKAVLLSHSDTVNTGDLKLNESPFYEKRSLVSSGTTLKEARQQAERDIITTVLGKCGGNVSQAARQLDIDRKWLTKMIKDFGIEPGAYKE